MDNQLTPQMMEHAKEVVCEECKHDVFVENIKIRKISKLITGSEKDQVLPIPVICCASCGHINKEFQPKV